MSRHFVVGQVHMMFFFARILGGLRLAAAAVKTERSEFILSTSTRCDELRCK